MTALYSTEKNNTNRSSLRECFSFWYIGWQITFNRQISCSCQFIKVSFMFVEFVIYSTPLFDEELCNLSIINTKKRGNSISSNPFHFLPFWETHWVNTLVTNRREHNMLYIRLVYFWLTPQLTSKLTFKFFFPICRHFSNTILSSIFWYMYAY